MRTGYLACVAASSMDSSRSFAAQYISADFALSSAALLAVRFVAGRPVASASAFLVSRHVPFPLARVRVMALAF